MPSSERLKSAWQAEKGRGSG
eukprot:COSAG04_NODE_13423_length_606_cov_210.532544_2_plen_20_part_01